MERVFVERDSIIMIREGGRMRLRIGNEKLRTIQTVVTYE